MLWMVCTMHSCLERTLSRLFYQCLFSDLHPCYPYEHVIVYPCYTGFWEACVWTCVCVWACVCRPVDGQRQMAPCSENTFDQSVAPFHPPPGSRVSRTASSFPESACKRPLSSSTYTEKCWLNFLQTFLAFTFSSFSLVRVIVYAVLQIFITALY